MTTPAAETLRGTASIPSGGVVDGLRSPHPRLLITEPASEWRDTILHRLKHLCSLPVGWDGYRAGPVHFDIADFAFELLKSVCTSETPAPSIVPGMSGDLQIEWHLKTGDIELHVRAPNDVIAWRRVPGDQEGEELSLTIDFAVVAGWLRSLVEPASAAIGAAA